MKTVLLCRVSSKEQEETGYSLPAQEKFLSGYADRTGYSVDKVFSISESASGKKQREMFSQMMHYVQKQGIKIIICEKVDRLTRNFKDAVMIDEWLEEDEERQVHLVKDSLILHKNSRSQEKLNWGIRILFAKNYIDNLSEEVKKGQKEKIAQGWLPTKPPVGYQTVGEKGHKIIIIDNEKAVMVKKMFELYASGNYSLKKLTLTMFEEGLRSYHGVSLVKSRIHRLLREPFYIGKIKWNDQIYDGKHEPLITNELFDKVQNMLTNKTTPKLTRHDYLFNRLCRCAECNGLTTWESQRGGLVYGHCNHYHECSQETWVREEQVEEQIIDGFDKLAIRNLRVAEWLRKALKESHADEAVYHTTTVEELNKRYEQIKRRIDKLYDDKLDEKITMEFYNQKFKQYTGEKDTVLETIKKHSQASNGYYNFGVNFYELSQRAKQIYLTAKKKKLQEEQRCLIRLVFTNLRLDEGKLLYDYTKAFKILAQAVKETNCSKVDKIDNLDTKTFEHGEKTDTKGQSGNLLASRPIWLPLVDSDHELTAYRNP